MKKFNKTLEFSWSEIYLGIEYLAERIKPLAVECGSYATLVGITRGGMIVASWLSHVLESKKINTKVYAFGVRSYVDQQQFGDPAGCVLQIPDKGVLLEPVFIVDDVVTTGDTLEYVKKTLKDMGVPGVLTCALYSNGASANFIYESVDRWVVFPWEVG